MEKLSAIAVGFYAWISATFFGGILLDIVYFKLLSDGLNVLESTGVFSEIADALLCLGAVVFLAACGAIAASWKSRTTRSLLIASLLMLILEFVTPVFFSWLIPDTQNYSFGPWLRLTLSGLASLLAFLGLQAYYRQGSSL